MRKFLNRGFLFGPDGDGSSGTTATVETAAGPVPATIEVEDANGQVVKLTAEELRNRFKTYAGKAVAFDKTAEEKAQLEKRLGEVQTKAEFADQFQGLQARINRAEASGVPDPEAFEKMALLLMGPEQGQKFLQSRVVQQQPQPQQGIVPPAQIDAMLRKLNSVEAQVKAGPAPELTAALKELTEWKQVQEKAQVAQQVRDHLLQTDPILGKLISDEKDGTAILSDVVSTVLSKRVSGQPVDTGLINASVAKYRAMVNLIDRQFPAQSQLQPGMFGALPTAAQTTSRVVQAKEPKLEDYKGKDAFTRYMDDAAAWANRQMLTAAQQ